MSMQNILETLRDLHEDPVVPRNMQGKILAIIKMLEEEQGSSLVAHRALSEIETMAENANLPSYTRTQLLNVVSMLEGIN